MKKAWLHKANDNYYTDEKFQEELAHQPWLIKSYIPGVDPESFFTTTNAQGWENGAYPSTRTLGVNLKLEFY